MSQPFHTSDANFNEVHGPMYYEEDRSQTFYQHAGRHYTDSSGPHVYMPQGHHGPPAQGTVNIGYASGNVNTGAVTGVLHQSEGSRQTVAPQPSRPPPSSLPHTPPRALPYAPQSRQQPSYQFEDRPLYEEPAPPFPQPSVRERYPEDHTGNHANSYDARLPQYPPYQDHHRRDGARHRGDRNRDPQDHHAHRPYEGQDYDPRDSYPLSPPEPPHEEYHGHAQVPQNHDGYSRSRPPPIPPLKDRNPFRNMSADSVPPPHTNQSPRPPVRSSTTSGTYTANWVAKSQGYSTPPRAQRWTGPNLQPVHDSRDGVESDTPRYTVRSPSQDERSSPSSSTSPVSSRTYSHGSSATTYSHYSPVPEEYEDHLHVNKPGSRSSTPGIC